MALNSTAPTDTSNAKLISRTISKRNLRDAGESFFNLVETTKTEVYEWYALTETAATTAFANNSTQPSTGAYDVESYVYDVSLDNRVTESYTLRRTYSGKTIAFA